MALEKDHELSVAFLGTLTGNDPTGRGEPESDAVKAAVARRFEEIKDKIIKRQGDYIYDGNRCKPENLGWRFIQSYGMHTVPDILGGKCDALIEGAYHENASSEHWYTYEKDWGR